MTHVSYVTEYTDLWATLIMVAKPSQDGARKPCKQAINHGVERKELSPDVRVTTGAIVCI